VAVWGGGGGGGRKGRWEGPPPRYTTVPVLPLATTTPHWPHSMACDVGHHTQCRRPASSPTLPSRALPSHSSARSLASCFGEVSWSTKCSGGCCTESNRAAGLLGLVPPPPFLHQHLPAQAAAKQPRIQREASVQCKGLFNFALIGNRVAYMVAGDGRVHDCDQRKGSLTKTQQSEHQRVRMGHWQEAPRGSRKQQYALTNGQTIKRE